jgi:hypothetical protein
VEPRIDSVVAIAPFANLSNAVMNIRQEYADWMPKALVRAGIKQLPAALEIPAGEFDTTTVMRRKPVLALFVAGGEDKISPPGEVQQVRELALAGSELVLVRQATHEGLTYYFDDLAPPIIAWLDAGKFSSPSDSTNFLNSRK